MSTKRHEPSSRSQLS